MSRFQILSLIGGGIRGAFVTALLKELEQKHGRPIAESFDLIAGTSTGGIIAAGLALGLSADQMHNFYVHHGAQIFTPRPPYKAKRWMRFVFPLANWVFQRRTGASLDAAFRARFCPFALQDAFDEGFGDMTMRSVAFTRLIIPAVNLTNGEPHVFRSRHLPLALADQDIKIADVAVATTAAPTYFPHRPINGSDYVDGGMWANDPSLVAIAEAMRIRQFETGDARNRTFDDVHLLSIGTGRAQFSLSPPGADAGILYWAPRVADVMGTSQVQGMHLPLKFLLGERYRHVNFKMTQRWRLDAVQHMPELFRVGRQRAEQCFSWVNDQFLQHRRSQFSPVTVADDEIQVPDDFGFE